MTTCIWDGTHLSSDSHMTTLATDEIRDIVKIQCPKMVYIDEDEVLAIAYAGRVSNIQRLSALISQVNAKVDFIKLMEMLGILTVAEEFSAIVVTKNAAYTLGFKPNRIKGFTRHFREMYLVPIKQLPVVIGSGKRTVGKYIETGLSGPALTLLAIKLDGFHTGGQVTYVTRDNLDFRTRSHLNAAEYEILERHLCKYLLGEVPKEAATTTKGNRKTRLSKVKVHHQRLPEADFDGEELFLKLIPSDSVMARRLQSGQAYGEFTPTPLCTHEVAEDNVSHRVNKVWWGAKHGKGMVDFTVYAEIIPYGPLQSKLDQADVEDFKFRTVSGDVVTIDYVQF